MVRVLIDSNFLMAVVQFRIDVIQELQHLFRGKVEPILISPVKEELRSIASRHETMRSRYAARALEIARKMQVVEVARFPDELVDDVLLRVASARGWPVATNDRRLRKRLDEIAVPTIYLRQRSRLEAKGVVG